MQKFILKEARIVKTHIIEVHLLFTFVVKDFAFPHLQVRFVSARLDVGQVHEVNVVSVFCCVHNVGQSFPVSNEP
jgi:hypothetical protein